MSTITSQARLDYAWAPTQGTLALSLQGTMAFYVPLVAMFLGLYAAPAHAEPLLFCLCCAQVTLGVWMLWSWRALHGRWLDAYSIFALVFFLFMGGGSALVAVFRTDTESLLSTDAYLAYQRFDRQQVVMAMLLVNACLTTMHLAALFGSCAGKRNPLPPAPSVVQLRNHTLRQIGWALVAVSAIPAASTVIQGARLVAEGGYMALFLHAQGYTATDYNYFVMLASGLTPGALILLGTAQPGDRLSIVLAWTLIVALSVSYLALGTRAAAFQNAIALLWLHHWRVRRIKTGQLAAIVAAGALVASLVRWSRMHAGEGLMSLDDLQATLAHLESGISDFANELGSSIITVVYTLDLVPSVRPHGWGDSYFFAFLSAIPNLFWDAHPSLLHGSLGQWLIEEVSPQTAAIGGGLGYSLVAEAYYNFDWLGSILVIGALGLFLGRFTTWAHEHCEGYRLALTAILISILPFTARADSHYCVRRLIFLLAIPHVLSSLLAFQATRRVLPPLRRGKAALPGR